MAKIHGPDGMPVSRGGPAPPVSRGGPAAPPGRAPRAPGPGESPVFDQQKAFQTIMSYLSRHERTFEIMNNQLEGINHAIKLLLEDIGEILRGPLDDRHLISDLAEKCSQEMFATYVLEAQEMVLERREVLTRLRNDDPTLEDLVKSVLEWNGDDRHPQIMASFFPKENLVTLLKSESTVSRRRRKAFMESTGFLPDTMEAILSEIGKD